MKMMMEKTVWIAAAVLLASGAGPLVPPAHAQGAFDMGALTNTLSQDAARRQAQKRVRNGRTSAVSSESARARTSCANARRAAGNGRDGAQLRQLLNLCSRAGY